MRRLIAAALVVLAGCASAGAPTVPHVAQVDLPRFMGDWYVIAAIPSFAERDAFDAVESYAPLPDGRIQTTFRYRKGGFDVPIKTMRPVGSVVPGTGNAVWGMQFIWPIKAEYVIGWLAPDYSQVLVVRSKRDYAWVMARTPRIPEADYLGHVERLRAMGYDVSKLRRVPQRR
ncbi:lipocalin family protein [Cognatilysobacter lacus]|uniref:Outer membrane lipoprotein Blc n=1 Tax=Cognatilysobacter lacus TaxID=1643323 RepID=A0A5D8Z6H0_9GAMM|nr:lipocalin family protein [Lysobacter lacus]TZF90369.1 lipocalin family protein [Lysobacter lacus]